MNQPLKIDVTPMVIDAIEPYMEGMSTCVRILLNTLVEVGDDSTLERFQRLKNQDLHDKSIDVTALGVIHKLCQTIETELDLKLNQTTTGQSRL